MLDWNLKATWDSAYEMGVPTSQGRKTVPGYWRKLFYENPYAAARTMNGLLSKFTLGPADEVLFVGAGFGFLAEKFVELAPGNIVVAIDSSSYVQATKGQTETAEIRAMVTGIGLDPDSGVGQEIASYLDTGGLRSNITILNEDLTTNQSRKAVKDAAGLKGGQKFKLAVSEDVLPTLTDAEALSLSSNMGSISTVTAHLVTPLQEGNAAEDPDYNWKTLADWRALVGPDRVVSTGSLVEAA